MNDLFVSLIRTYVPIAVGLALSALGLSDIEVDTAAITGAIIAVYYLVARVLETRWPVTGILLGRQTPPQY